VLDPNWSLNLNNLTAMPVQVSPAAVCTQADPSGMAALGDNFERFHTPWPQGAQPDGFQSIPSAYGNPIRYTPMSVPNGGPSTDNILIRAGQIVA
jgi:hypothetical protein